MEPRRLYRSKVNKVFAGVAGGLAEFFGTDPVLIRVLFVLAVLFGGGGVLVYVILWIAVPEKPVFFMDSNPPQAEKERGQEVSRPEQNNIIRKRTSDGLIGGLILIVVGIIFLIHRFIPEIEFKNIWPFAIIIAGVILLVSSVTRKSE